MRLRFLAAGFVVLAIFFAFDVALPMLPCESNRNTKSRELSAEAWIGELQDVSDPTSRSRAADALWQFGEGVVAEIVPCLHHQAAPVRSSTCTALKRLGPAARDALPELLELVRQPDEAARVEAIAAIASIGIDSAAVIEVLTEAARDPAEPLVGQAAISALGQFGEVAMLSLIELLQGGDLQTQRRVLKILAETKTHSPDVCQVIASFAAAGDVDIRLAAFAALAAQGELANDQLTLLLGNEQPEIRAQAATAYSRMGREAQVATTSLLVALQDDDANVRFWALRALGQLRLEGTEIRQQILRLLDDPDADVRWQAAETIARTGLDPTGLVGHWRAAPPIQ